ncbi:MAG: hypothetical protein ACKO2D_01590 [Chloroflexota bacterium]
MIPAIHVTAGAGDGAAATRWLAGVALTRPPIVVDRDMHWSFREWLERVAMIARQTG